MLIIFTIFLQIAVLASAINRNTATASILIALFSILFGLVYLVKVGIKIKIPPNFSLIVLFDFVLFIYLAFITNKENPIYYALTFSVSTFYWLIFFNLKKGGKILKTILIFTSLVTSLVFMASKTLHPNIINLSELLFLSNANGKHYFIGNIWAFVLVMILGENRIIDLKKWVLMIIGFLFLVISNSRSALISLMAGLLYFKNSSTNNKGSKNTIFILLALLTLVFVLSSSSKTTIFSRPYFIQSIESFAKYPFGIGMGNFEKISLEYYEKTKDLSIFSIYTHNIFLETLSGVGVFSILFLMFIFKSVKEIIKRQKVTVWGLVFISITVSFMLDTSYTIPGLMWIWFMVYGVYQKEVSNLNLKN